MAWRRALLGSVIALAALPTACGGSGATGATGTRGTGGGGGGDACATGQLRGTDDVCRPIGVQGCADAFLDADGLCRPSIARCKKGTIPKFDEGCVAVGIPTCAKEFLGSDGFCHVSAAKCPAGTMAIPEKGCVSIDGADGCGSGTWGDIPDGANVRYVDPTFSGGASDGTKAAPFTTLTDALAVVPPGGVVALAAGVYHEFAELDQDVEIRGRCASKVTLDGHDASATPSTIYAGAGSVTIRHLTLAGDGVGVYADTTTLIDGVVIDGALHFGVVVNGVTATVQGSLVENTRSLGSLGGLGVYALDGSELTVTDSSFVANRDVTIDVVGVHTTATIDDVLLEKTQPTAMSELNGEGVVLESGATMHLTSSAVVASHLDALDASAGSVLHATHVVVERTLPQASDGYLGAGLEVYQGGKMSFTGSAFFENDVIGLLAGDSGTELHLDTTLVQGTLPLADGTFGRGLEAQDGAHVTAKDSAFVANHDIGIIALSAGTEVDLDHVLIEGTLPHADGTWGVGVVVDDLALLHMDASVVSRSHVAGAVVAEATATISASLFSSILAGTIILQNPAQTIPAVGDGVLAMLGGAGPTIDGTRIEGCARAGVLFDGGTGAITNSSSTKNRFGVVLEGGTTASADQTANDFAGNTDGAEVDDVKLDVPDQPAALPE